VPQLAEIERAVIEINNDVKAILAKLQTVDESLSSFHQWKNGDSEKPGVVVRLDRVERFQQVLVWAGGIVISAFLLAGTAGLITLVRTYGVATANTSKGP